MEPQTNRDLNGPEHDDTAAETAGVEDTAARRRPRRGGLDRGEQAELLALLAKKKCCNCGQIGCWDLTSSGTKPAAGEPRIRWVRCRGCQRSEKIVLE